jgi:tetratricopeptide (TPR) repeat protein
VLAVVLAAAIGSARAQRPNAGEDDSVALVDEGRAALRANKLDAAAKALDQAIALNPRRVEAYVLRGTVYAARKQYRQGIALMRRALELAPENLDVVSGLGTQLVLAGDASGVPLLQHVVGKEPQRYDAQLVLGHYWHDAGRWPDAITALEAYFAHRPSALASEDAGHRIDLGDAYLRFRKPDKALAMFRAALERDRTDLRARIAVAWATAAIDCRKARPLLRELEPVAEQHPEVWLVDGQCALALGDIAGALALGRRYLERAPKHDAAGHALVGEAQAARGNLAEAKREFETARAREPARRRWTVRLAFVLRRAGQSADAVAKLDELGPPSAPSIDPEWWQELGEALLATADHAAVLARVAPVVADLPGDATIRVIVGAANLAAKKPEKAMHLLSEAEAIVSTPRSRKLLAEALATVAANNLAAGDPDGAEPLLARAETLDPNPIVWRDLGIARLELKKYGEAIAALDRAMKADPSPIVAMLDARARALAGDIASARPIYERALAAEKDSAVEVALDWAATEVGGGDPVLAVVALERTANAAKNSPLAARHKAALAIARHAAGLAALRAGNGGKAVELLRASITGEPSLATRCDLAAAAVAAGDANAALVALKAVARESCPFPPPADTQAVPILSAFVEGLNVRRAPRALDRLTALGGKSSGAATALLGTAIRVVALNAAQDAYRNGALGQARAYLATARSANARAGADEVAYNLAVLDLAEGRLDAAIAQLERVAPKVPDALVALGIAYERKNDPTRALDAWRRAKKAGVRFAPLAEWIESKERVYGGEP